MSINISKAAIVTGASRGIGKDIALRLAADGFAVAIGYAGNQAQADAVKAEIQATGGTAITVKGNVADVDDVNKLFSSAQEAFGRPADIANAVSFPVGKDGGWVNSQVVQVNGGFA